MTDFNQLVPELRDWGFDGRHGMESWTTHSGSFPLAIGYSTFFWPSFVVFERYVLMEGFSESAVRSWERETGGDRQAVEATLNHLHIADMHDTDEVTRAQLIYLGRTLREIYQVKLAWQFPDRTFEVWFNDEPDPEPADLTDYQITFYQVAPVRADD